MTGDKRSHVAPDVPTVAEAGVPGYAFESWMGAAGPAGIPRDLAAKISADINAALKSPDVSARLQEFGLEIAGSTPDELGAHMRDQVAKMQKLVRDANIPLID
jgi:tripartite-type tricarboxylate transporter receptor subunit TctC